MISNTLTLFSKAEYEKRICERDEQEDDHEGAEKKSDDAIYMEVAGGLNKKGRVYGLGPVAGRYKCADASSSKSVSTSEYETMKSLVASLTDANKQLEQKMKTYDDKFESMETFMRAFTQNQHSPPSPPSPPMDQQNQDDEDLDD